MLIEINLNILILRNTVVISKKWHIVLFCLLSIDLSLYQLKNEFLNKIIFIKSNIKFCNQKINYNFEFITPKPLTFACWSLKTDINDLYLSSPFNINQTYFPVIFTPYISNKLTSLSAVISLGIEITALSLMWLANNFIGN